MPTHAEPAESGLDLDTAAAINTRERVDERRMLDLLLARYTNVRTGTIADRWVRAEHVASHVGHRRLGRTKVADFIAADRYPGVPYGTTLALHGHEVKVSRSDWLTELRAPEKADAIRRYMHHWWLVVSDANIVRRSELPKDWGLLVRTGDRLRVKVAAPRLTPEPVPLDFTISLMAAAARTAYRDPLHRDAPTTWLVTSRSDWTASCAFCGELRPCSIHQPRMAQIRRDIRS